jgi:GAF domain-containing protein
LTARGRRFLSVHRSAGKKFPPTGSSSNSKRGPIKLQQTDELSRLLVQYPAALQRHLEKLTLQQRIEIHRHLLRQHQPPATATAASATTGAATVAEPSRHDLYLVAVNTAIPFVGFGIMDNSILIIAGDAIDTTLGVALGISTMCAAAIGNIISDVAGVLLGTFVEDFTQKYLSVPSPVLSDAQRKLRSVRYASQFGCAVGLVIGCIIGMFPLAFMDSNHKHHQHQVKRQRRHSADIDTMCQEVVVQAGNLVHAEQTFLYILCDPPKREGEASAVVANPEGKYLHAKYTSSISATMDLQHRRCEQQPSFIPLGQGGTINRTLLTREVCNVGNDGSDNDQEQQGPPIKNMICVPVLDGNDRTIGVLQVINKKNGNSDDDEEDDKKAVNHHHNRDHGFTAVDVQILKAMSSHIAVSLQRIMTLEETTEDGAPSQGGGGDEEEKMRLRDTIRILKDSGLVAS